MSWSFASTSEPSNPVATDERPDGMATTEAGQALMLRRAGGPWGRARGLFAQPALLDPDEPPRALWLGRTPQVHTRGMSQPVALVTAEVTRRGSRRGRPGELRVGRVDVIQPGMLGRWSWPPPVTLELHPAAADRLGLATGSTLAVSWRDSPEPEAP